jgi:glutathione synthase/RimK-type ligase-like ATP-grasp enzyme
VTVVNLLTARDLPKPDPETHLVVAELERLGASTAFVAWDEPGHDWGAADVAVIRSTWDYFDRRDEFVDALRDIDAATRLVNPLRVVEWNSHKGYLPELARAGVPVVPTTLARRGEDPAAAVAAAGSGPKIVKPAVSGGAQGAGRFEDDARATEHLARLLESEDALVQPFMPDVLRTGERSLIFFGGELSHALNKRGAEGDFRIHELYGGSVAPHQATGAELGVARTALAAVPEDLLYARVDLVEGPEGPLLMELELIEPELFLGLAPSAPRRMAELILARARS